MFAMVDVEGRRKKAEVNPPPAPPRGEIQEEGRSRFDFIVSFPDNRDLLRSFNQNSQGTAKNPYKSPGLVGKLASNIDMAQKTGFYYRHT